MTTRTALRRRSRWTDDPERTEGNHVVQVALSYPPRIGGMENVTQAVATHLASRYRVEVATTSCGAQRSPREEMVSGVHVQRFRGFTIAHTPVSIGLALHLLRLPRNCVVHAHLTHAFLPEVVWLTSWLKRRRYIAHFHLDVDPTGVLGFLLKHYKRFVFGPALRGANTVIALSKTQADWLTSFYRVPAERVRVVPNGVSESFFSLRPTHRDASADGPLRLLFVGRLDRQKNVQRLLAAIETCSGIAELAIVGDGEQRELLKSIVRDRHLDHVRLIGVQRGSDLDRWYEWADAFILTSDREGMPVSLLEAMAAGLPIIATAVPGTQELLTDIGLLVEPAPNAISRAIEQVAADPELRQLLAARSRNAGSKLSWSSRIAQIDDIYHDLQRSA